MNTWLLLSTNSGKKWSSLLLLVRSNQVSSKRNSELSLNDLGLYEQNSIANITIVSDHLNKIDIGKKPPSKYMLEFKKYNSMINETMETHLIGNMAKFGISDNSYTIFLKMRAKKIHEALEKKQLQWG